MAAEEADSVAAGAAVSAEAEEADSAAAGEADSSAAGADFAEVEEAHSLAGAVSVAAVVLSAEEASVAVLAA